MHPSAIEIGPDGHAELEAFLIDRIYEFNSETTGHHDAELFAASIPGPTGEVIAAVTGHTWGGTCYVSNLWVHADFRGEGHGRSLMAAVEASAKNRGCAQILLSTHSFQAPKFYERLGFKSQGFIPEYPKGYAQLNYCKRLDGLDGL